MAALIPFGVLLADYAENGLVITMLQNTPRQLASAARAANSLTLMKFLPGWLAQAIRARTAAPSHAGN
jgi:hypothetical protein